MNSKTLSFLYLFVFILCTSACILKGSYKNNQFEKDFLIENHLEKNSFSKSDSILFSYKKGRKKFLGDTFYLYLNKKFLHSNIFTSGETYVVPLVNSQFGENVLEVRNNFQTQKLEYKFSVFPDPPKILPYKIIAEYHHEGKDFTQGLIMSADTIIESTGGYGTSVIKMYNYKTGKQYVETKLDKKYFGEGITKFHGKIFLLTYKEKEILIFNEDDLELLSAVPYNSEGWGLTHDERHLIISNGSSILSYIDPDSFEQIKVLKVFDNEGEVKRINELEYVNGEIYANIWYKNEIVVIDPGSGAVTKKIDFHQLVKTYKKGLLSENVLNGIAYDEKNKNLFITGKRWPLLFQIQIKEE